MAQTHDSDEGRSPHGNSAAIGKSAQMGPGDETQSPRPIKTKADRLRAFGWKVHSRPDKGEPIWIRNGKKVSESLALEIVQRDIDSVAQSTVTPPQSRSRDNKGGKQ
jgi:hypothetical protein